MLDKYLPFFGEFLPKFCKFFQNFLVKLNNTQQTFLIVVLFFCSVIHLNYSLIKTILNKLSNFLESERFFNYQWQHSEKSQKNFQIAARSVKLRASGWLYRSDEGNMEKQSDTWLDIILTMKLWYVGKNVAIFLEANKKVPVKPKKVLPKEPQASTSRARRVARRNPPLNHLDVVNRGSSSSED